MARDKEVRQSKITCPCNAMSFLPIRYMVTMLSFLGFTNFYAMRVNLSVAIPAMVANQTVMQDGKEVQEPAEFSWTTAIQGNNIKQTLFSKIALKTILK